MKSERKRVVFLRGRKVILRPVVPADAAVFACWINDPEVRQYLLAFLPLNEEGEKEWIKKFSEPNAHGKPSDIVLMIETLDGKPIGTIGIHQIDWKNRRAATGTLIGEKRYWGKGYGTDAKMLVLEYCFNELGLHKLNSSVIAYNERSCRYSLRCGYKREGVRKDTYFRKGRFWDEILLGIRRTDWEPVYKKYQKTGKVM